MFVLRNTIKTDREWKHVNFCTMQQIIRFLNLWRLLNRSIKRYLINKKRLIFGDLCLYSLQSYIIYIISIIACSIFHSNNTAQEMFHFIGFYLIPKSNVYNKNVSSPNTKKFRGSILFLLLLKHVPCYSYVLILMFSWFF